MNVHADRWRESCAWKSLSVGVFLFALVLVKASTYDCILRQQIGPEWMLAIGTMLCFVAGLSWGKSLVARKKALEGK